MLIRLCACTGWSEPLLFAYNKTSFSPKKAHITWYQVYISVNKMGLNTRNPVFRVCEQQRCKTSLHIHAVYSAPLLLAYWKVSYILTCYKDIFNILASLCNWAGWFEPHIVRNPENRFSRVEAQMEIHVCCEINRGCDRNIRPEDHRLASRGLPSDDK